jgi:hypothetical protein
MNVKSEDSATLIQTDPIKSSSSESREGPRSNFPRQAGAAGSGGQTAAIEVDDTHVTATYANFCRVSSTPEELILDLGLNPQPMNPAIPKVTVSQRTIMNHYTAKRLLAALSTALQRHESAFGVLETDVRRRVRGG